MLLVNQILDLVITIIMQLYRSAINKMRMRHLGIYLLIRLSYGFVHDIPLALAMSAISPRRAPLCGPDVPYVLSFFTEMPAKEGRSRRTLSEFSGVPATWAVANILELSVAAPFEIRFDFFFLFLCFFILFVSRCDIWDFLAFPFSCSRVVTAPLELRESFVPFAPVLGSAGTKQF